jgi:hypothetical protein
MLYQIPDFAQTIFQTKLSNDLHRILSLADFTRWPFLLAVIRIGITICQRSSIAGRLFTEHCGRDHVRRKAWRDGFGLYWVALVAWEGMFSDLL